MMRCVLVLVIKKSYVFKAISSKITWKLRLYRFKTLEIVNGRKLFDSVNALKSSIVIWENRYKKIVLSGHSTIVHMATKKHSSSTNSNNTKCYCIYSNVTPMNITHSSIIHGNSTDSARASPATAVKRTISWKNFLHSIAASTARTLLVQLEYRDPSAKFVSNCT